VCVDTESMCGIGGILNLKYEPIQNLRPKLEFINELQKHRGPDDKGIWIHDKEKFIGFAHRRLSIIDLDSGHQPISDCKGNWIVANGEIYNYKELKQELKDYEFLTNSDTEVILEAYKKWGPACVNRLRGMFAFAIWDEEKQILFCSRDRFGIKPFYYTINNNNFYFASEAKALLPFLEEIETDLDGFQDYLSFQFCLGEKTLFKNIYQLLPSHNLIIKNGHLSLNKYWEVYYEMNFDNTDSFFKRKIEELLLDSTKSHLVSDVSLGAYVSGGLDSSLIASIANQQLDNSQLIGFTGKFSNEGDSFDESFYANEVAKFAEFELQQVNINSQHFLDNIKKIIYHLDYPVAGPGSFPQYMVSALASKSRKVVLGGQGGDEIFGGYTRYLVAYFEQCIKGAIDGTLDNGNFIVTYDSIIPNLASLKNYKPMLKEFWSKGLFDQMDARYFRLINRSNSLGDEIFWENLDQNYSPLVSFKKIFHGENVNNRSYFDLMTHFDFKTLLPALLQVEDRVSMAHGLESRVPLLDHSLVEFAATIPSDIKFKDGMLKRVFKETFKSYLPKSITQRKDKMGFPVPLNQWIEKDLKDFVYDTFSSSVALSRDLINNRKVLNSIEKEPQFGRKIWGFLCLELWQQEFHDQKEKFKLNSTF